VLKHFILPVMLRS